MNKTTIAWTDYTSNPLRARSAETGKLGWYCTKVSPGCAHCYSERINLARFGNHLTYDGKDRVEWAINYVEMEKWEWRRKPAKIFVCDMLDLFHESIPYDYVDTVFLRMAVARRQTFQVLTKRPERMRNFLTSWYDNDTMDSLEKPLSNVWLGVSVENQRMADERIPLLLQTPAAVRFLSCEPLLGPVDLRNLCLEHNYLLDALTGKEDANVGPAKEWERISWVIVGGESGPGYRPMDLDWARSIRDQCQAAGVPYFFKQSAGPRPGTNATLDGVEWHEFPK